MSCIRPLQCRYAAIAPKVRSFSTTATLSARSHDSALKVRHADLPQYPYGPARWYKQSNMGLYGGQTIRFGNNVGEKSEMRSRRSWHPNLITRNLRSTLLNTFVRVKLTTRVLRTIDKSGGLDAYLLGTKPARLKELGMEGWKLRCQLLQSKAYLALSEAERVALLQGNSSDEQKLLGEIESLSREDAENDAP